MPAVYAVTAVASNAIGMSIGGVNDYVQNLHTTVNTSSRMREWPLSDFGGGRWACSPREHPE